MEFLVEMFLMVVFSLLLSYLVSKLVSVAMAVNDLTENPEIVGLKMDASMVQSERYFEVVDQNVETVDRFDEIDEKSTEAVVSPEVKDVKVPENVLGEEIMIESYLENEESAKEAKVEEEEEEDDDWEGIERSELEKAFGAAANYMEESGKAEEIGAEVKMELYGLHKIATQGSCRETQPMALMVSARAKWNAWNKLGDMSQEEAMEKYVAVVSEEVPGWNNTGHDSGSLQDQTTLAIASYKNV